MKKSYVTITDQFCGAGGSSIGATAAGAELVLGLNHWKLAIETHNTNFPNAGHDCTDISACDPRRYPSTDILITSPECTNHSLAKGKRRKYQNQFEMFGDKQFDPAAERSRATMWDVVRFAEHHKYNLIIVENVVDARLWQLWEPWLNAMSKLGYNHEIVYFNSMFAWPTPQSRDRMYVVFWKRGNHEPNLAFNPPAYCPKCARNVAAVQSWKNPNRPYGKYKQQYVYLCPECATRVEPYYYCAANAIDWTLPVQRIGDRSRPLKPKTLARIEAGLKKFARTGFMVETAYSHAPNNRFKGVEEPLPTQSGRQTLGMAVPPFLLNTTQRNQDSGFIRGLEEASFTQTTGQTMGVAIPPFIMEHIHEYRAREIREALSTVVAEGNHHSVVVPPFLAFPNQTGDQRNRDVSQPYPTQTASLSPALVVPPMVVEAWNTSTASPITDALAAVVAGGNHHYLLMPPFLMGNYTPGTHQLISGTFGTVTTQDHHSLIAPPFLTSYYGTDSNRTLDEPVGTVTTLDRHALVSPEAAAIKVEDCGFRMLQPHEIQNAMAFPGSYKVLGNSRDKVKQLGNAVTPPIMQMLIERCLATFN